MAFEQAIGYASVSGAGKISELQIVAPSAGLDESTISQLKLAMTETLPAPLPHRTVWEMQPDVYRCLAFYRLPNGKAVLSHTAYLDRNKNARQAKFFTRFIIHENPREFVKYVFPAFSWHSDFWKAYPEAPAENLPSLPTLNIHDTIPISYIRETLSTQSRLSYFAALASAVQHALNKDGHLVIADQAEYIAIMIGAVALALPLNLQEKLSFTISTANPSHNNTRICGSNPDTVHFITESEFFQDYHVFDFINEKFSELPRENAFANTLSNWYANDQFTTVLNFKNFLSRLEQSFTPREMDELMQLYLSLQQAAFDKNDILAGLAFTENKKLYKSREVLTGLMELLKQPVAADEDIRKATQKFFKTLLADDTLSRKDVLGFLIDWVIYTLLANGKISEIREATALIQKNFTDLRIRRKSVETLRKMLLASKKTRHIAAILNFAAVIKVLNQLESAIIHVIRKHLVKSFHQPAVQQLLAVFYEKDLFFELELVIYRIVSACSRSEKMMQHIRPFLGRKITYQKICERAKRTNDYGLLLRLKGAEIANNPQKEMLTLETLREYKQYDLLILTDEDYEMFFQLGWPEGHMAPATALPLIHEFGGNVLRRKSFLKLAVEGVALSRHILFPKGAMQELVSIFTRIESEFNQAINVDLDIANLSLVPEFQRMHQVLSLSDWHFRYGQSPNTKDRLALVGSALEILPKGNRLAISAILEKAFLKFLSLHDGQKDGLNFLLDLSEMADAPLYWQLLADVLDALLRSGNFSAAAWPSLFKVVARKYNVAENKDENLTYIYAEKLQQIYNDISISGKETINRMIQSDAELKDLWKDWKKEIKHTDQFSLRFFNPQQ